MNYLICLSKCSDQKENLIFSFVAFFLYELKLNKCVDNLIITSLPDDVGFVGVTSKVNSSTYIISIDVTLPRLELGRYLAHEFVHLKQLVSGKLLMKKSGAIWKGRKYSNKRDWLDQPWEIEALKYQEVLVRRYQRISELT